MCVKKRQKGAGLYVIEMDRREILVGEQARTVVPEKCLEGAKLAAVRHPNWQPMRRLAVHQLLGPSKGRGGALTEVLRDPSQRVTKSDLATTGEVGFLGNVKSTVTAVHCC